MRSRCSLLVLAAAALGLGGCFTDDSTVSRIDAARVPASGELGRNVARIPGRTGADLAAAAALVAYAPPRKDPPRGVALGHGWRELAGLAQLAAPPVRAALLDSGARELPVASRDVIRRLHPPGIRGSGGVQAVLTRSAPPDALVELDQSGVRGTRLEGDAATVAADAARARAAWADAYPRRVVVASLDDPGFALPAAAWSAYSGDALVFVTRGGVPPPTSRALSELRRGAGSDLPIYVIAPRSRIPTAVAAQLRRFGPVRRVGGESPMLLSIKLARYDDPHTDFGWGLRKGRANVLLASTRDLPAGSAALAFAAAGPRAPLLLTDDGRTLPHQLLGYLRSLRSAEGPGQGFVFGSPVAVSSDELGQVDAALSTR